MNESQRPRVLFVNSGILGHRAVAALLEDVSRLMDVSSEHINLSGELTLIDRIQRWILSRRFTPRTGAASNLDLRRWREELNVGLFAARRIAAARRANQFDVVHFHPQPTAYASLSLMKRQKAIVSIDATQQLASEETRSPLDRATYVPNMKHDGWVFRRARAIVSTSEWAARSLAANYPDCARKAHVLPYPVRSCADASLVEARYARAELKHAPVRVLFMGGDFPRKGGLDLLDAWRSAAFGDRATLDLVTDWPIDARDVPPGARVIGGVAPNTPAWEEIWRDADLFVMPTRHEAFGMVFQEAAAAGVPVLATSVNAVPEIVRDGVTGVLVAPGDGRALVAALRTLVDSADLRRRMGAAALERMREEGSTERYARKLEGIIHSVMDAGDADGNGDSSKVLSTPPPHLPTPAIARPHGTLRS